jgi:hypothetical protein
MLLAIASRFTQNATKSAAPNALLPFKPI